MLFLIEKILSLIRQLDGAEDFQCVWHCYFIKYESVHLFASAALCS